MINQHVLRISILILLGLVAKNNVTARSVIIANYHNVLMFFPKELGGNDDVRVIFDVRNVTQGTFKYLPVVVAVEYDSRSNNAYLYLESAITSYIMLLKWSGGRWCYQVLFEFPASNFSKFMYHSIILWDSYIYWTTDRFIMSGRLPGYEKRLLLQPSWNQLYSMALDKSNEIIYVAAFDYTENALFSCSLRYFVCTKLIKTEFTLNYIYFNIDTLYLASIDQPALYKLGQTSGFNYIKQVTQIQGNIANMVVIDSSLAIYSDQQQIKIVTNYNSTYPRIRRADAHLIDPYALQYVFSFNKIFDFDGYPYPYQFSDYHNLLYKNNLYIFYFYVCGMSYIENDLRFLPQMDLNSQFLYLESCQNKFHEDRLLYVVPMALAGAGLGCLVIASTVVFCWRTRNSSTKKGPKMKSDLKKDKKKIDIFEDPSMMVSPSIENWASSIKHTGQLVNGQSEYNTRALTNLHNLDINETNDVRYYTKPNHPMFSPTEDFTNLSLMSSASSLSSISSITTGRLSPTSLSPPKTQLNDNYISYIELLKANKARSSDPQARITHPSAYSVYTGKPSGETKVVTGAKNSTLRSNKSCIEPSNDQIQFRSSTEQILLRPYNQSQADSAAKVLATFQPSVNTEQTAVYSVNQLAAKIEKLPNITNVSNTVRSSLSRRESYLNIIKAGDMSTDSSDSRDVRI